MFSHPREIWLACDAVATSCRVHHLPICSLEPGLGFVASVLLPSLQTFMSPSAMVTRNSRICFISHLCVLNDYIVNHQLNVLDAGLPLLLSLANKNVDLNAGKFVSIPELLLLDWEQLPELTHQSARSYQIVMGSDIVYDGIDLHAIWNAVDWSLDYTAGAQFVLSHEAGLYASLYTCLLVTKCLQVIATELTRKSISLVLQRKCDGFEEDEWLLAFRAQGGTMGFIIVYQHMADDVYLDVWERNT